MHLTNSYSYNISHILVLSAVMIKLTSKTAKIDFLKEQITIYVKGLGWDDCHHAWTCLEKDYSPAELAKWLKEDIIEKHTSRRIPNSPKVSAPTRKKLPVVGTLTADVIKMDREKAKREEIMLREAEKVVLNLDDKKYEKYQDTVRPTMVDLVGRRIEYCMEYTEPDGTKLLVWAKGNVEGVPAEKKKRKRKRSGGAQDTVKETERNQVIVKWDERYLTPGEENFQTMKLMKSKYNKRNENAWRCLLVGD